MDFKLLREKLEKVQNYDKSDDRNDVKWRHIIYGTFGKDNWLPEGEKERFDKILKNPILFDINENIGSGEQVWVRLNLYPKTSFVIISFKINEIGEIIKKKVYSGNFKEIGSRKVERFESSIEDFYFIARCVKVFDEIISEVLKDIRKIETEASTMKCSWKYVNENFEDFSDDIMRFRIVKIEHDETATVESFIKRIFPLVELFNRTGRILRFTGDWNPILIQYIQTASELEKMTGYEKKADGESFVPGLHNFEEKAK
mgnify:FL=1